MTAHAHVVVSRRLALVNGASSLLARLINVTVLLWMYQYLLARVPAEEFAIYPVVAAVMVAAPLFFSFFTGGISRYVVNAYARGDRDGVTRIVSSATPLLAAAGAVFLAAALAFAAHVERVLTVAPSMVGEARLMLVLLAASFSLQMLALPFATGFHVRQRFVELNAIGIGRDLLRIALLFALLLYVGPNVLWVVVATATADVIHNGGVAWRGHRLVPELRLRGGDFAWTRARQLLSFGLWTTLGRLGGMMLTSAATILLNQFGGPVDVNSFHVGTTFLRQIENTVGAAMLPLQPVLTALHAQADETRLRNVVLRGGRYALWLSLAGAAPLTVFADPFVMLYLGGSYSQTALVLVLLMATFPFTQACALLAMTAMAMARVRAFFLPAFMFQLLALVVMLTLAQLQALGATAAAACLAATMIASQLLYFWPLCLRLTGLGLRRFLGEALLPGLLPAVGGAAAWAAMRWQHPPATWAALALDGAVGAAVYATLLLALVYRLELRSRAPASLSTTA